MGIQEVLSLGPQASPQLPKPGSHLLHIAHRFLPLLAHWRCQAFSAQGQTQLGYQPTLLFHGLAQLVTLDLEAQLPGGLLF